MTRREDTRREDTRREDTRQANVGRRHVVETEGIVTVTRHVKLRHFYDFQMNHLGRLKKCSSVECHIVVYPFSRRVNSKHLTYHPYEEYARTSLRPSVRYTTRS